VIASGALLTELTELFVVQCATQRARIRDAIAARDIETLAMAAHALKGSAGNMTAAPLAEVALRLERMGLSGDFTGARW
jgi:HPt (histidine-containing phosphotransfer) domain-containing protein